MSGKSEKRFGIFKVLGIIIVLFAVLVIALPFIINVNQFRPQIESNLAGALGRDVQLGNLKLSLWSGELVVKDIVIADNPAFSRDPFVTAKSLQVKVELIPLIFSKKIRITGISLDEPVIALIRDASGQWNFSNLANNTAPAAENPGEVPGIFAIAGTASAAGDLPAEIQIKQFKLTNGRVRIVEGKDKTSVYDDVNVTVRDLSLETSFPFTLATSLPGGGTLKLEGKAGPLNRADSLATPLEADLTVARLDLVASGVVPPDSGLAGVFDFKGAVTSDGSLITSKGHASAEKLQVLKGGSPADKPVSLDYAVTYDSVNKNGTVHDTRIGFGKAFAALAGNYEMQENGLLLKMKLNGTNMPVQDLTGLLPAFAVTLPKGSSLRGGTLNAVLAAEGPVDKLMASGTADVMGTRLVGYDLSGNMAAVAALVGIKSSIETEIEKFASSMKMTPDGIEVSNLLMILPSLGRMTGEGKIAADQSLDFTMQALLKPSGGGLTGGLARLTKGNELTVPFLIRGTASDPKFVADTKNAARSLLGSALSDQGSGKKQEEKVNAINKALRNLLKKKKQ